MIDEATLRAELKRIASEKPIASKGGSLAEMLAANRALIAEALSNDRSMAALARELHESVLPTVSVHTIRRAISAANGPSPKARKGSGVGRKVSTAKPKPNRLSEQRVAKVQMTPMSAELIPNKTPVVRNRALDEDATR